MLSAGDNQERQCSLLVQTGLALRGHSNCAALTGLLLGGKHAWSNPREACFAALWGSAELTVVESGLQAKMGSSRQCL